MGWSLKTEWRIGAFVAHCLAAALDQVEAEERDGSFQVWYATFEQFSHPEYEMSRILLEETKAMGLLVLPVESDYDVFFPEMIDEELARLAALPTNAALPCSHPVGEHKNALSEWQEKNLST